MCVHVYVYMFYEHTVLYVGAFVYVYNKHMTNHSSGIAPACLKSMYVFTDSAAET